MKRCNICKIEKPLECFSRSKKLPDGHINQCKPCNQARQKVYRAFSKASPHEALAREVRIIAHRLTGEDHHMLLKAARVIEKNPG